MPEDFFRNFVLDPQNNSSWNTKYSVAFYYCSFAYLLAFVLIMAFLCAPDFYWHWEEIIFVRD